MVDILSDMPWEVVMVWVKSFLKICESNECVAFIIMLSFVFLKDFDGWLDK